MSNPFFKMFGPSPLSPLQEHMSVAHECTQQLIPFFEAVYAGDWPLADKMQAKIAELEKKADNLKKDLRLHLPKGMLLPVHRNDLLKILTMQDGVANRSEDIAGLVLGRRMVFPAPIRDKLWQLVQRSVAASEQANKAIHELDELLETGFRGREVDVVETMIVELDKIEHETDDLQVEVRRQLFEIEKDFPAVDVIFYYQIIEWVGDLADRAELIGGNLQLLLAR